jgi:hypothetical protein
MVWVSQTSETEPLEAEMGSRWNLEFLQPYSSPMKEESASEILLFGGIEMVQGFIHKPWLGCPIYGSISRSVPCSGQY